MTTRCLTSSLVKSSFVGAARPSRTQFFWQRWQQISLHHKNNYHHVAAAAASSTILIPNNAHGSTIICYQTTSSIRRYFGSGETTITFKAPPPNGDASSAPEESTPEGKGPRSLNPDEYTEKVAVHMPDMAEGSNKILKWYKQPGDVVLRDDVLCDIETPDFVFGMETDDEHPCIMGEIVVPAPSGPVADGEVICYLMHPSHEKKDKEKK